MSGADWRDLLRPSKRRGLVVLAAGIVVVSSISVIKFDLLGSDLKLGDWADIASLLGTAGTMLGLLFVAIELVAGTRAARAQATILFQERFRDSQPARTYVVRDFPVHRSLLKHLELDGEPEQQHVRTWLTVEDLEAEDVVAAREVINALNDVGQYVADGLELRSALQQYHAPFIQLGYLLQPYLALRNEPTEEGKRRVRYGRRVPVLYNAALAYHRCHPKHRGRVIGLGRPSLAGGDLNLVLLDDQGDVGLEQLKFFKDSPDERLDLPLGRLSAVVRRAEAKLRR